VKSNIHVDAELLAAWSEGSLPKDQAAQVEVHLADCSTCQEMLAVFARTDPTPAVPVVSGFSRTWRWAIPLAAAATVAAIWVSIPEDERTSQLHPTTPAPLSDAAPLPATDADAAASAQDQVQEQEQKKEKSSVPRRDARGDSFNRAEKAPPAGTTERFESARSRNAQERDQDLKAEAAQPPASAAVAAAAPAARDQATPPPAPAQGRLEAEARSAQSSVLREVPAEIVSPDPLVRWRVISPPGRLERSSDGGKTWTAVPLPQQLAATRVVAPTATTAIVTASDGRQFRTEDQGKTWNLVQP
jgi:hypothetical protein